MAALLKSGKFLRMVTGLARPGQQSGQAQQQPSLLPLNNTTNETSNGGATLGEKGGGLDNGTGSLIPLADGSATFQAWSLSHLQSALPVLAGGSEKEEERRKQQKDPLLSYLVDKQKVEEFCNKTWSDTQKELVEIEKELEDEKKAMDNFLIEIENEVEVERKALGAKKNNILQSRKESPLKSNSMLTKGKKKKVPSSKQKAGQGKHKELGRVVSLNIIYEEPGQTPPASSKAICSTNETPRILRQHENKEIEKSDVVASKSDLDRNETETKSTEKSLNSTSINEDTLQNERACSHNTSAITLGSRSEKVDHVPEERNNSDINAQYIASSKEYDLKPPGSSSAEDNNCELPSASFPPPDDNWQSRLPLTAFPVQSASIEEKDPPVASGVYYSGGSHESNFVPVESTNASQQQPIEASCIAPPEYVPMVQVFEIEPYTEAHWYPLEVVCRTFREQGRYWDLECLLDGSRAIRAEDRQTIYYWTLQAYADASMFERAVALSGQLHLEGLGNQFPAYHQLMSSFAAAQQSWAPTLPYSSYAYSDSEQMNGSCYTSAIEGGQDSISSQNFMPITPSDVSLVSTPRSSCPPTPCPPSLEDLAGTSYENLNEGSQHRSSRRSSRSWDRRSSRSSTERKVSAAAANSVPQHLQRRFKKALNEKNWKECLTSYNQLEELNVNDASNNESNTAKQTVNVTDSSSLIELLVKNDQVRDATHVAENILAADAYPIPKIFRFLLNRLASNGDVHAMSVLGSYLTPRVKKEVSFDNRLCNAYLAAGQGQVYLDMLQKDVDDIIRIGHKQEIDLVKVQAAKDKFPRGGAMGLLESDPELVENFTTLAHKFAQLGYIAPMNVLWTYHFIGGRHDIATPLWQDYVQTCPQIMFQKVCQTARSTCNADIAQRLVNLLENASTVTMGARGIAYSCLLDVLTQQQNYVAGVAALKNGLDIGLKLEDVNRTALKRLKHGLEETTKDTFPFEIPQKDGGFANTEPFLNNNEEIAEPERPVLVSAVAMLN